MNTKTLYQDLMALCENSESFHFKDFTLDDQVYRIFNYRLASWTEFEKPNAKNCRGAMFNITDPNVPYIVSLPMEKFFNYEEGNVDHSNAKMIFKMEKLDGSLISTYLHKDEVRLKSKASLFSEQAVAAMAFLNKPENAAYKEAVTILAQCEFTVNFEYTAPTNRVVVPYQTENLTIISIRDNVTGWDYYGDDEPQELLDCFNIKGISPENMVKYSVVECYDQLKYVDELRQEEVGEGYVIALQLPDGERYRVKVKNHKYLTLHSAKDGAQNPKRLCEAVIDEVTDDLRSLFADDPYILGMIKDMEDRVIPVYNHMINQVEHFYESMKDVDRKTYAIAAKSAYPQYMGLLMNLYLGQPNDYKEFAKKNMKELFGVVAKPNFVAED